MAICKCWCGRIGTYLTEDKTWYCEDHQPSPSSAAGGEKCECGHKLAEHSNSGDCDVWECQCLSFKPPAPQEAADGGWRTKQVREAAETVMAICQGERDCADAMEEYGTIIVQSAMHRDAELLARYVLEAIPQEAGR